MSHRFLLAFAAFILIVGAGALWLVVKVSKRKKLTKDLLSLPRERRFFWYKLRDEGFQIIDYDRPADFSIVRDGDRTEYSLKLDFLAKRDGKVFACLFSRTRDDKELLKLFFSYSAVFKVDAVIFCYELERSYSIWEW